MVLILENRRTLQQIKKKKTIYWEEEVRPKVQEYQQEEKLLYEKELREDYKAERAESLSIGPNNIPENQDDQFRVRSPKASVEEQAKKRQQKA